MKTVVLRPWVAIPIFCAEKLEREGALGSGLPQEIPAASFFYQKFWTQLSFSRLPAQQLLASQNLETRETEAGRSFAPLWSTVELDLL